MSIWNIWNKGKDAGNKAWGQTKNTGNKAWGQTKNTGSKAWGQTKNTGSKVLGKTWTVTRDFHVNSYNKGVSGAKWVGNKVKFW